MQPGGQPELKVQGRRGDVQEFRGAFSQAREGVGLAGEEPALHLVLFDLGQPHGLDPACGRIRQRVGEGGEGAAGGLELRLGPAGHEDQGVGGGLDEAGLPGPRRRKPLGQGTHADFRAAPGLRRRTRGQKRGEIRPPADRDIVDPGAEAAVEADLRGAVGVAQGNPGGDQRGRPQGGRGEVRDHEMDARVEGVPRVEEEIGDGRDAKRHRPRLDFEEDVGLLQVEPGPELGREGVLAFLLGVMLDDPEGAFVVPRRKELGRERHGDAPLRGVGVEAHLGERTAPQGEDQARDARQQGRGVHVGEAKRCAEHLPALGDGQAEGDAVHRPPEMVVLDGRDPGEGEADGNGGFREGGLRADDDENEEEDGEPGGHGVCGPAFGDVRFTACRPLRPAGELEIDRKTPASPAK